MFSWITYILIMCPLTHFNIKVWVEGFPFCHLWKIPLLALGIVMEYGEEDESFTRFLQNLDSGLEIGENLESEPPEPSWCAGTSAGDGWELVVEGTQTEASLSHVDETVVFGNIDNHVRSACQSFPIDVPKQVWETGIWSTVFSDRSLGDSLGLFGGELRRPVSVPLHSDVATSNSNLKRKKSAETYKEVVRHKVDISWREHDGCSTSVECQALVYVDQQVER